MSELQAENLDLRAQVNELTEELARSKEKNQELEGLLRNRNQELFGRSTEKGAGSQKEPPADDQKTKPSSSTGKKKRGARLGHKGAGRKIPKNLPVVEVVHEIPEAEKVCTECGEPYCDIPMTENSSEVDIEVRIIRRDHRRRKAVRTCQCHVPKIITAAKPAQVIPKSKFSNGFWAYALVLKFFYQIPLNRQAAMWEMFGYDGSQGTIIGGFDKILKHLEPLYELLKNVCRQEKHWNADETGARVYEEVEEKKGYRWWLWTFVSKLVTVFILDPSRSSKVPKEFFGRLACGILNVDRYAAYQWLDGQLIRALCWYHVRRDFINAQKGWPQLTDWAQAWIDDIHRLERLNEARLAVQGTPAFKEVQTALLAHLEYMAQKRDQQLQQELVKLQQKILKSLRKNWSGLTAFAQYTHVPMHNNTAERALRPAAVGRKNYYGYHAVWSGHLAAVCMTIFQTAAKHDLDVLAYLKFYLDACAENGKAPDNLEEFLPWNLSPEAQQICRRKKEAQTRDEPLSA